MLRCKVMSSGRLSFLRSVSESIRASIAGESCTDLNNASSAFLFLAARFFSASLAVRLALFTPSSALANAASLVAPPGRNATSAEVIFLAFF